MYGIKRMLIKITAHLQSLRHYSSCAQVINRGIGKPRATRACALPSIPRPYRLNVATHMIQCSNISQHYPVDLWCKDHRNKYNFPHIWTDYLWNNLIEYSEVNILYYHMIQM